MLGAKSVTIVLGLIAIFAIFGLILVGTSRQLPSQEQQRQDQHQPASQNATASEKSSVEKHYQPGGWTKIKQSIERNEKVVSALSSVVIAAFTVALVLATGFLYFSSEKVADAAKKSAVAAKDSADLAKQALIAGQRAFVSVSFRYTAHKNIKDGKIYAYGFTPVWYNAGNTPTRNMENHINIRVFEKEITDDWDFPNLWNANVPVEKRVPTPMGASPKIFVDGHAVAVDIKTIQDIIDGKKFLYLWGSATYSDVFPDTERHVTRFAVQIAAGGNPEELEHMSFSFPLLGKYNCSDEECKHQGFPADWKPRQMIME
jgi:hypothetical protein